MKAIRIHAFGGPEQLKMEDLSKPFPKSKEVLVKVMAAGVNPVDYKIASGMRKAVFPIHLPWIPGKDFSGVIEKIGEDVQDFFVGQEVFGNASGSYAEYLVASVDTIAEKSGKLHFNEAAAIPIAGLTAWQCLFDHGHLKSGQTVLIHGASGGVGTFAVQLARWKNAKVIATGSENHEEFLKSIGVDQFIDYKKTPFETVVKDVDLVLDLIGGDTQKRSFPIIKQGGYLVSTLETPSEDDLKKYKIHGTNMRMQVSRHALEELSKVIEKNNIQIFITKTYPLDKVKEAWKQIITGHTHGKIILIP